MAVSLPSRSGGGSPRSGRGPRLPGAEDVPRIQQASDPGLRVPQIGGIGAGLEAAGELVTGVLQRQQKLQDATTTTEAKLEYERVGMEQFNRSQTEGDPSSPTYMKDFETFLTTREEEMLKEVGPKVSNEARERLRLQMVQSRQAMVDSAGRLQIGAQQKRAQDAITTQVNQWAAQASRDPGFLDTFLDMADEGLSTFSGALTPDQERDARTKARNAIITSALGGMVTLGKPADAEVLLGSGKFDADLSPENRQIVANAIKTGKKIEAEKQVLAVQSAVSTWFQAQPDPYAAAEQLYSGNIRDPGLKALYEGIPIEDRSKVFRQAVDDSTKLVTLQNQQRDAQEAKMKENVNTAVREFYFNPDVTSEQRTQIMDVLRKSPYASADTLKGMERFMQSGGREGGADDQRDLLNVERAVRNNEITTDVGLLDYIDKNGLRVSLETSRERFLPLIEAKQNSKFNDALKWGQSELGIVTGSVLGDVFKDPVNKAAQLEAELRRQFKADPEGDLWSFAEKTVARLKKQGNSAASAALPTMTQAYRDALASGDPQKIANSKAGLTSVMMEAGMVDALEAARSDFNPLKIIDKPRETP